MAGDDRATDREGVLEGTAAAVRDHVREHRTGMLVDLLFALVWVTVVSVLFEVLDGPQWAYYMTMAAGVVAYYGFFWSLERARARKG